MQGISFPCSTKKAMVVDVEELIMGCVRMRGTARSTDMMLARQMLKEMRFSVNEMHKMLSTFVETNAGL